MTSACCRCGLKSGRLPTSAKMRRSSGWKMMTSEMKENGGREAEQLLDDREIQRDRKPATRSASKKPNPASTRAPRVPRKSFQSQ